MSTTVQSIQFNKFTLGTGINFCGGACTDQATAIITAGVGLTSIIWAGQVISTHVGLNCPPLGGTCLTAELYLDGSKIDAHAFGSEGETWTFSEDISAIAAQPGQHTVFARAFPNCNIVCDAWSVSLLTQTLTSSCTGTECISTSPPFELPWWVVPGLIVAGGVGVYLYLASKRGGGGVTQIYTGAQRVYARTRRNK